MQELFDKYIAPLLIAGGTFLGWLFNRQIARIDKVEKGLDEHKLHVAKTNATHATHADLDETKDKLYKRWDKLESELKETTKTANLATSRQELDVVHARINDLQKTKKRLEIAVRHLRQLDTVKSEFVSIAAHQLRTPLTGIKWTLNALASGDIGKMDSKQGKVVRDSLVATNRLVTLVDDLLNVARLEEGRMGIKLKAQDLLPILTRAEARFSRLAQTKGLKYDDTVISEIYFDGLDVH